VQTSERNLEEVEGTIQSGTNFIWLINSMKLRAAAAGNVTLIKGET
jgi:hypothetical protein